MIAGGEHDETRRSKHAIERFAGLAELEWWGKQARMCHDTQKLAEAEYRDRPARTTLGQRDQSCACGSMLRQLLAVGVDENIGVDRDHPRPSILS